MTAFLSWGHTLSPRQSVRVAPPRPAVARVHFNPPARDLAITTAVLDRSCQRSVPVLGAVESSAGAALAFPSKLPVRVLLASAKNPTELPSADENDHA